MYFLSQNEAQMLNLLLIPLYLSRNLYLPNKEGTCSGKIIIHYEDSNGDEVTQEQEFNDVYVNAAYDPGMDDNLFSGDFPIL